VQIHGRNELQPGRFGLLQPDPAKAVPIESGDNAVCLVPGIAFTQTGARIGYGGGYYDRFLAHFSGISIGLAFELQLAPSLPQDSNDKNVNFLVTENNWYTCH
jgi:5-formyltetrahydrofolate cyclo-ligase